jgi:hypothetical protein
MIPKGQGQLTDIPEYAIALRDLGLPYKGLNNSHFLKRYALYSASFFKIVSTLLSQ